MNWVEVNTQLMQSLVDWLTTPGGCAPQLLFRSAPRMPTFCASQLVSPNVEMMLKMRLKPAVIWLMLRAEKICVSEIATFRPWLVMPWLLANAPASANPGEPPGTYEVAWS